MFKIYSIDMKKRVGKEMHQVKRLEQMLDADGQIEIRNYLQWMLMEIRLHIENLMRIIITALVEMVKDL